MSLFKKKGEYVPKYEYDTLRETALKMEEKLKELMGEEEYLEFASEIAKEAFRKELEGMADSEFKRTILEPEVFDAVTGSQEDYLNLLKTESDFQNLLREEGDDE